MLSTKVKVNSFAFKNLNGGRVVGEVGGARDHTLTISGVEPNICVG